MSKLEYTRLTYGRRRRKGDFFAIPGTRAALWVGEDHILHVHTSVGSEDYRRFYFKDIQAIIVRSTKRQKYLNFTFLGLLLITVAIGASYGNGGTASIVALFLSIILFGAPLLVNNLLGPCCDVQIRTAVQTEDLPSLCRIRRTARVLDRIRPRIEAAQGNLSPEDIAERVRALERPPGIGRPAATSPLGLSGNEAP